jgi:hypothetical protein
LPSGIRIAFAHSLQNATAWNQPRQAMGTDCLPSVLPVNRKIIISMEKLAASNEYYFYP